MKYVKPTIIIHSIIPVKLLTGSPHPSSDDNNEVIDGLKFDTGGQVKIGNDDDIL